MKTSSNSMQIEDSCSLLLFAEEGRMFNMLVDHAERFPEASPYLMLTILPFCAITVHDGVIFARKRFGKGLPFDTQDINSLRNRTKSLSSKGLSLRDYSEEAVSLTGQLSSYMKSHTGLLGPLLNAIQPDTSIVYHDGLPVLTSYVYVRYVAAEHDKGSPIPNEDDSRQLGYDIGKAAAINCVVADIAGIKAENCEAREFVTVSKDLHFSKLIAPVADKGIGNRACFFMLSELLTQINSVEALHKSGFFSDLLYLKFQTAALLTAARSIKSFTNSAMPAAAKFGCTEDGLKLLSSVIPREMRRAIEKTKRLRHAFVHYDFINLVGEEKCKGSAPFDVLESGIQMTVGISTKEYFANLHDAAIFVARGISNLIELPSPAG